MIRDVKAYKEALLTKTDKWGDQAIDPEVRQMIVSGTTEKLVSTDTTKESCASANEEEKSNE